MPTRSAFRATTSYNRSTYGETDQSPAKEDIAEKESALPNKAFDGPLKARHLGCKGRPLLGFAFSADDVKNLDALLQFLDHHNYVVLVLPVPAKYPLSVQPVTMLE